MEPLDDRALIVRIALRDQVALAEAYQRHSGVLFALACRIVANRNLAEEIVQEIFVRLWEKPARYVPERGSLRSFLLADTHGRAIDCIRSESARMAREESVAPSEAGGGDLEREVLDLVQAEAVRRALQALDVDERIAIELAYFGGHTYREVAALLATPEGTIKSRIRSGLARFRTLLTEAGYVR